MNKKCFVDTSITLSDKDFAFIKTLNLDVINYDKNESDHSEVDYFLLHNQCADQLLIQMKNCKYIGIRAHNTDYVNKKITEQQGITVQGLKNQHGINAVAEHTFSLIFALSKNLVNAHENVVEGLWRKDLPLNYELNNKRLGLIGYGQIGRKVAELGKAFGMEILIAGKKGSQQVGEMSLEQVLKEADIVSMHLSSKEENNNYIGYDELALMKDSSILINTARGSVLDYAALDIYLKQGKFLGVGLDVFDKEPLLSSSLTNYSNVILTPHSAYMTNETLNKMNNELLKNLEDFISSKQ